MEPVSDWSALPRDLLVDIAMHTLSVSVEDFMAFRGVCTSWRTAATEDKFVKFVKSWPIVPFLMLPEKEGTNEREFYSLSRRKICMRFPLPEANAKRCIEARFGWFLTLAYSGGVNLLNPFSGSQIELPNLTTFPAYDSHPRDPPFLFIQRAVLSANPSNHHKDFVLVVLSNFFLGFWRPGDKNWTMIESHSGAFLDLNYYNQDQKFYAVNTSGYIWVWDPLGADLTVAHVILEVNQRVVCTGSWQAYLVESTSGELLLVTRDGQGVGDFKHYTYGATRFRVFRIDVLKGSWEEIGSLGNDTIFVGHNAAISIAASDFPDVIKSNCIYFSDDSIEAYYLTEARMSRHREAREAESESESDESEREADIVWPNEEDGEVVWEEWDDGWKYGNIDGTKGGGKDMGVYSLEDGSIERFEEDAEALSFTCPPLWVAPSSFSWLH